MSNFVSKCLFSHEMSKKCILKHCFIKKCFNWIMFNCLSLKKSIIQEMSQKFIYKKYLWPWNVLIGKFLIVYILRKCLIFTKCQFLSKKYIKNYIKKNIFQISKILRRQANFLCILAMILLRKSLGVNGTMIRNKQS